MTKFNKSAYIAQNQRLDVHSGKSLILTKVIINNIVRIDRYSHNVQLYFQTRQFIYTNQITFNLIQIRFHLALFAMKFHVTLIESNAFLSVSSEIIDQEIFTTKRSFIKMFYSF